MKTVIRKTSILFPKLAGGLLILLYAMTAAAQSGIQEFQFDILRNGKPVGEHALVIDRSGAETRVVSRSEIDVRLLGISFYRMQYQSEELWDDSGIRSLVVEVNDGGKENHISGHRRDGRFYWSAADGQEQSLSMPVFPTNHWNPGVLQSDRVLNTLTGSANSVTIDVEKDGPAFGGNGRPEANIAVYRYEGDLNIRSWYDRSGRWHGLRFKGRDGSDIEYVCRNCSEATVL